MTLWSWIKDGIHYSSVKNQVLTVISTSPTLPVDAGSLRFYNFGPIVVSKLKLCLMQLEDVVHVCFEVIISLLRYLYGLFFCCAFRMNVLVDCFSAEQTIRVVYRVCVCVANLCINVLDFNFLALIIGIAIITKFSADLPPVSPIAAPFFDPAEPVQEDKHQNQDSRSQQSALDDKVH